MNLQFHPILEGLPALMTEEQLEALGASIKKHGQKYEILGVRPNFVLDGRNRYLACKKVGVEPKIKWITSENLADVLDIVLLKRKHLTPKEKRDAAVHLLKVGLRVSTDGLEEMTNGIPTENQVAAALGVSKRTVARAKAERRSVREILREISPAKLAALGAKEQPRLIKKLKDITDEIGRQNEVNWVDYPKSLFERAEALREQAERVAGLDYVPPPEKKRRKVKVGRI